MSLWELVEAGDHDGLRRAVANGANPNRSFHDSDECLLTIAASKGDAAMVRLLLELGADPNCRESVTPPLVAAAASGLLVSVVALLAAGAEVDVRDEDGSTPLMIAAACGHTDAVNELLQRGANPKLKDESGCTALYYAVDKGHADIQDILMPVSTQKEREMANILRQVRSQAADDERVSRLVHYAATRGDFDEVKRLVNDGVAVDSINKSGATALMRASNKDHREIVQWLLERGADVNRKDIYGSCPLIYAAMGCHPEMYDFCIH